MPSAAAVEDNHIEDLRRPLLLLVLYSFHRFKHLLVILFYTIHAHCICYDFNSLIGKTDECFQSLYITFGQLSSPMCSVRTLRCCLFQHLPRVSSSHIRRRVTYRHCLCIQSKSCSSYSFKITVYIKMQ